MGAGVPEADRLSGWRNRRVFLYVLAGFCALDALVFWQRDRWAMYDPNDYEMKPKVCRERDVDFLIVGGSPVTEGIDPSLLMPLTGEGGSLESAYNLALPGGTTSEVWHAVKSSIRRPPHVLLYGITASDLNDARDEPQGPRTLMTAGDFGTWQSLRGDRATEWALRHYSRGLVSRSWQVYRHAQGIRLWAAEWTENALPGMCSEAAREAREAKRQSADLQRPDGYAPRANFREGNLGHMRAQGALPTRFPFLEKYQLGGHLGYLHHLLDWAETQGVLVVLVDMPVSEELECERFPDVFATYRAALNDLAARRQVPLLRAHRTTLGLTDDHFADLIHLNAQGSTTLTMWLKRGLAPFLFGPT